MLIEFRVENFRSIGEEQALTTARGLPLKDAIPRSIEGSKVELLPSIAIYGANASGKSNVLQALQQMRWTVMGFALLELPMKFLKMHYQPFAWGQWKGKPTLFEVEFVKDGVRYRYGFTYDAQAIHEEWLSAWPKGREQKWFHREGLEFEVGEKFREGQDVPTKLVHPSALFLTVAQQFNHPYAATIMNWFSEVRSTQHNELLPPLRELQIFTQFKNSHPSADDLIAYVGSDALTQLLQFADVGITKVKIEEGQKDIRKIYFQHGHHKNSWLEAQHESEGTRRLLCLAPFVFRALKEGSVLLVDELEASLHPALASELIRLFNDPESNPRNAQLIFTTHDTNLLSPSDGERQLRRDQIWFTEKGTHGVTHLYPLTDFKPRNDENLERGYLQGRYGAVPGLHRFHDLFTGMGE